MAEQLGEKTFDPTPLRREQARREGKVAKSNDLVSAVLLIAALLTLLYLGRAVVDFMGELTVTQLGGQAWMEMDQDTVVAKSYAVGFGLARVLLPLFSLLLIVAVFANAAQVGFMVVPQRLSMNFSHVDPIKGLSRLFSLSNSARLGFGLLKILVVVGVALANLWSQRNEIVASSGLSISQVAVFIVDVALWTCLKIGLALLALAILDYGYQRWKHEQDLRMTPQQMREEMKQMQGNPQITARRRAVQRQLVLNNLQTIVPLSNVVIMHAKENAVAIRYDAETMSTPLVVAKGAGVLAQQIHRLALANEVPIVERKELARRLTNDVDLNQAVPEQYYESVAEVLRSV